MWIEATGDSITEGANCMHVCSGNDYVFNAFLNFEPVNRLESDQD